MVRYLVFTVLLLFCTISFAKEAPVSFYGGIYAAKIAVKGNAGPHGQVRDVRKELDYDKADQWVAWLGIEHDHSPWPKVQLHHTGFSESGTKDMGDSGPPFTPQSKLYSKLNVNASDLVFYYTLPSLPLTFDLGGGIRRLEVAFDFIPQNAPPFIPEMHKKTTQHIPIVYASAFKTLPLKGTYASAAIVASRFKDRKLYNSRLALGWISDAKLGVELGYNHQRHRFKSDESVEIDLKLGGPFVAVSLHF